MAGSFGYEAEHFSPSRAIGDILFDQLEESDAAVITTPGASCRTQLEDGALEPVPASSSLADTSLNPEGPPTPIELLNHALPTDAADSSLSDIYRQRMGYSVDADWI